MECRGGIHEAKGHSFVLVMALVSTESDFGHVLITDLDLTVSRSKIQLGKHGGSVQLIELLVYHRNWELIGYDCLVQYSVINTKPQTPNLLLREENGA